MSTGARGPDLWITPRLAYHSVSTSKRLDPGKVYPARIAYNQPGYESNGAVFALCDSYGDPCHKGHPHAGDSHDRWADVATRDEWDERIATTYHDDCPGFLLTRDEYHQTEPALVTGGVS